jgi:hypothetical protein
LPADQAQEAAQVPDWLDVVVGLRIYPGMAQVVSGGEIAQIRRLAAPKRRRQAERKETKR